MASLDESRSVPENTDEGSIQECGLCLKEGKRNQSNHFCQNCDAAICDPCRASHFRFPVLRKHNIVPFKMMKKDCGLCHTEGVKVEAQQFCRDCDSWICDSCKDSHLKFPDLSRHSIVGIPDKMTMASKPTDVSSKFSRLSTTPSDGSSKSLPKSSGTSSKPASDSFKATANAGKSTKPDGSSETPSLFSSKPAPSATSKKFKNKYNSVSSPKLKSSRKLNIRLAHDKDMPRITGCCFMPAGELVLCDMKNENIKLLDKYLSLVEYAELVCPHDVAVVDDKTVIVTCPEKKRLRFVEVLPELKITRMIYVEKECYGIDVAAGLIFVSFYTLDYERDDGIMSEDGEVRVYDLNGTLKKRIGLNEDGSYMFQTPEYIAVNESGDKIFVSDWGTYTVTCITTDGEEIVYQHDVTSEYRRNPKALHVDGDESVMVCFYNPTIERISPSGAENKELLSFKAGHDFGLYACKGMAVRPSDGTLVIGCLENENLFVFKLC